MNLRRHALALLELIRRAPAAHRLVHALGQTPLGRPLIRWMLSPPKVPGYGDWLKRRAALGARDRRRIAQEIAGWRHAPTISVVMPAYETPERLLRRAIESVRAQVYPHWELCIADDASPSPDLWRLLEKYRDADPRIHIVRRRANGHISAATNSALALASGDYVALMDHDDVLSEDALYEIARAILAHPQAALLYSDEDKIDAEGRRSEPYFKPAFNYELLLQQNLVSHLGVYRRDVLLALGGLRSAFDGSQDHDLALRVYEREGAEAIVHVPGVLYHWRQNEGDKSFSESQAAKCADAARRAVEEHLARTGQPARVIPRTDIPGWLRIQRLPPSPAPPVSLILAGADAAASRIREATAYRPLSAGAADGEILVFMDGDLAPQHADWLGELVAHAVRPQVGAVGAKILDAWGRLEDAGLILGGGGAIAGPLFAMASGREHGLWGHLALIRDVSAVSGACLAVRRGVLDEVGGLDAGLPGSLAALDLCLRLRRAGYDVVWNPQAELRRTRLRASGPADRKAFAAGQALLRQRWGAALTRDPFYNPNLDLEGCDYGLGPPRKRRP